MVTLEKTPISTPYVCMRLRKRVVLVLKTTVLSSGGGKTTENACLLCRLLTNGQSLADLPQGSLPPPRASPIISPLGVPRFAMTTRRVGQECSLGPQSTGGSGVSAAL